jgi:hypothetical protein
MTTGVDFALCLMIRKAWMQTASVFSKMAKKLCLKNSVEAAVLAGYSAGHAVFRRRKQGGGSESRLKKLVTIGFLYTFLRKSWE